MRAWTPLWYGNSDGAFFDYNNISKNRKIKYPMLPDKLAAKLGSSSYVRIPPKTNGEIRILSVDIALMSSNKHKNDATAIFINQMLPTKAGRYTSNIVYTKNSEGLRTEEQALEVRKLYDEFECDYIALDANGKLYALVYGDIYGCSAEEIGKAEMLIRVEGCM